jgi:hypothetical protein
MCTTSTPTGAPFRQETNVAPDSQTKSAGGGAQVARTTGQEIPINKPVTEEVER